MAASDTTPRDSIRVLLISGSTRAASTASAVLRTAADVAPSSIVATMYDGLALLPAFNPDLAPEAAGTEVAALRRELAGHDAVVFSSPEYAGTLPGSLKNLLDWVVGSGELYEKPVGWVNAANRGRGEGADATLALVLGYVGALVVEAACVRLVDASAAVDADGLINDATMRDQLVAALHALATCSA